MGRDKFLRYRHDTAHDDTLTAMSMGANFLYIKLAANDDLTSAGVSPLVPARFMRLASDMSRESFWSMLTELEDQRLVVVDRDTDEVMIRTYVRHSKVMHQPNRVKNLARHGWASVFSDKIRAALIIELARVLVDESDIKTWHVLDSEAPELWSAVKDTAQTIRISGEIPHLADMTERRELSRQFKLPMHPQAVDNPVDNYDEPPF